MRVLLNSCFLLSFRQTFLYIINTLSFSFGILLIIFSSVQQNKRLYTYDLYLDFLPLSVLIVLIILSTILGITCRLSLFNANTSSQVVSLTLIFLLVTSLELSLFINAILVRHSNEQMVESSIKLSILSYDNNVNDVPTKEISLSFIDRLQNGFECCGSSGPSDWNNITIPNSCCVGLLKKCNVEANSTDMTNPSIIYQRGCSDILHQVLENEVFYCGVFAFMLLLVQFGGVIGIYIKDEDDKVNYNL